LDDDEEEGFDGLPGPTEDWEIFFTRRQRQAAFSELEVVEGGGSSIT